MFRTPILAFAAATLALAGHAAHPAFAQPPATAAAAPAPRLVSSRHVGTFNGRRVAYAANVRETIVSDASGAPAVSMVAVEYVATGRAASRKRPVLFAFNGGPGAASLWLHMGALGPRRVVLPQDPAAPVAPPYRVVDNHQAPLDIADLVFIDAPGSGYSRILPGGDRERIYSAEGDAEVFAHFIAQWLADRGRSGAPVHVLGESYGTIRAVLICDALAKLETPILPQGIFLLGQAVNIVETVQRPANIVGHAVNLPSLAAAAWHHGKVDHAGRTLETFLDEVRTFAMNDYLMALSRGQNLDAPTRARIAERLSTYTGLPSAYYRDHELGISKIAYRQELFRNERRVLGYLDARYLGESGDPSSVVRPAFNDAMNAHIADWLHASTFGEYRPVFTDAPEEWPYSAASSPFNHFDYTRLLSEAMRRNPDMRLVIGSGYFDLTTTFGAAEYLVARSDLPRDRVELTYYPSGHMAYTDEAGFVQFTEDVRRLIGGRLRASP